MPTTDITEKGLETLIMKQMTGLDGLWLDGDEPGHSAKEGFEYLAGSPRDFDRAYAVDTRQLFAFLRETQPDEFAKLKIADYKDRKDLNRQKFLTRLSSEIGKRGVIDVLRNGITHGALRFDLFCATPSDGNARSAELHTKNRFSLTRQLGYSLDENRRALDLCLFINGLPIITFELKNSLTNQTVEDAVEQYCLDRSPKEKLFEFGRCVVHLAVDDNEVRMCSKLEGKGSWFLPLNKGWNDGAGNPPDETGIKTRYLWQDLLTRQSLTNILENYAQVVEEKTRSGRTVRKQIFPRYHQLEVVRQLLEAVPKDGVGKRYLIQHSAGSGKSNSIAWLAHQLIPLAKNGRPIFDSVIVVTDRTVLDNQIQRTIKQFMQVKATVGHAKRAGDLRRFIEEQKKIIVTTVQKFPHILKEIEKEKERTFAIIIDEAHSSQGGKVASAMNEALADPEDTVNDELEKRMQARKMLKNASYFAFTATPKNKTLELFGIPLPPDAEGRVKHRPFHSYTMKQAVQEGFIVDVLANYTPVHSYYKLVKKIVDDPEFDTKRAAKKLRRYVESHDHAIRLKCEIMVDHFHDHVLSRAKIGGKARAMIVCNGIARAIQYFHAFRAYLAERKSGYDALVAFSGEKDFDGKMVSESSLNGFAGHDIAEKFQEDPYRFLICADKFQTGYDEPLLHTMYVDKPLAGIRAVQTLSRLNRAHPQKREVFVLDFQNNSATIDAAFSDYYRTTILSEETDPNKLNDLKLSLDGAQVYAPEDIDAIVTLFLSGAERDRLDPILDRCTANYIEDLDEDAQIRFKGDAKAFVRTYEFLASLLPYNNAEWEKLSVMLNLLVPKLPAPKDEDLAKGVIQAIDMDSYRVEKKQTMKLVVADENAEIGPVPPGGGGGKAAPEMDLLSNILKGFNDQFGTLFSDGDRVMRRIKDDIVPQVIADGAYQNAKLNTPVNARIEHDNALERIMLGLLKDDTEVYRQFVQNESFKRFVRDAVYQMVSE